MVKSYTGVTRKEFLFRLFELLNTLQKPNLKLTEKEIWLLVEFMCLPNKHRHARFSTKSRRQVTEILANKGWILSASGMSQLLKSLSQKKVIEVDEDGNKKLIKFLEQFIDNEKTSFRFEVYFTIDDRDGK